MTTRIVVLGAGYSGQLAARLAARAKDVAVTLVNDRDRFVERVRLHQVASGQDLRERPLTELLAGTGIRLVVDRATAIDADGKSVVWTTGFTVPALAREAGFAVDGPGRMVVDDTLRSTSHPDVYGIGDAAAVRMPGGQELRMACATGLPAAQQAVRAVLARRDGRNPKPFRFRYVTQCISLGRRDGLIQFVDAHDRPKEAVLTGRLAALYKEVVVRSAFQAQRHPRVPTSF